MSLASRYSHWKTFDPSTTVGHGIVSPVTPPSRFESETVTKQLAPLEIPEPPPWMACKEGS